MIVKSLRTFVSSSSVVEAVHCCGGVVEELQSNLFPDLHQTAPLLLLLLTHFISSAGPRLLVIGSRQENYNNKSPITIGD